MDPAVCRFCGSQFSKKGIARHVASCVPKHVDSQNEALKSYFQFAIRSDDTPEYWLYLLVDPTSTLQQLDRFFRDTWLECCKHSSYFQIGERQYFTDEAPEPERRSMAVRLMDLPDEQVPMRYVYDVDSPTVLNISSVSPVEYADSAAGFIIAARNQPPPYTCGCGNHASILDRDALGVRGSWAFYCSHCITEYEGDLSSLAPLTNSPRMGICGYNGPSGDQTGEYQSFQRAEDVIRDFRRNHDSTRLSNGDATEREQIIRRYMRFLHSRSVDEGQLRHVRFISRNITYFASELRKLLDERFRRWRTKGERPQDPAHLYALYLLTDVADDTLFADIADSFSDYKSMHAVWGNAFQEPGARRRLFATVSREAPEPLIFFALQEDIDTFIQQSAIDALVALYLDGSLPREMLVDLLHQLAERAIAEQNEQVAEMTVSTCMVIYPEDVIRIVQRLVHSGLLDESRPDYLEAVRETLKRYRREEHLERVWSIGFYGFVEEPMEELRVALLHFDSEPGANPEPPDHAEAAITGEGIGQSQSVNGTIYRTNKKIGRNDPCPCGSGKKYKRCCGR